MFKSITQKKKYLSVALTITVIAILVIHLSLFGVSDEGKSFHWFFTGFSIFAGIVCHNYIIPHSKLNTLAFKAVGILFLAVALLSKTWAISTNPLFIISIFLLTARYE